MGEMEFLARCAMDEARARKADTSQSILRPSVRSDLCCIRKALGAGAAIEADDNATFDKACETTDLKAFVQLLSSTQRIPPFKARTHPWAQTPKTVGALAASQLAFLAS